MAAHDSYFADLAWFLPIESGRGSILPVRSQNITDSCYAFALVDIIYSSLYMHGDGDLSGDGYMDRQPNVEDMGEIQGLYKGSVQELLDCVHLEYPPPEITDITKAGVKNTLENIISFIVKYGVSLERNCRFLGVCRQFRSLSDGKQPYKPRIYIESDAMRLEEVGGQFTDSESTKLTDLIRAHPIGMCIINVPSFSTWKSRDIYYGPTPKERDDIKLGVDYGNHIVVLVGFDVDKKNRKIIFVAKNSRGTKWGYKGYIKLAADIPPPFYKVVVELTKRPSIAVKPFPPRG